MAYTDIAFWADMMNEELNEKEFWNEACAKRAAEKKALDEKEFNELDEKEIDPASLGITETEVADVAEEEKLDEEDVIDFSAYGVKEEEPAVKLGEADDREPITMIATALGKIASTANLTGQDSVKLNESSDFMTVEEAKGFVAKTIQNGTLPVKFLVMVDSITKFDVAVSQAGKKIKFSNGNRKDISAEDLVDLVKSAGLKWRDVSDIVFESQKLVRVWQIRSKFSYDNVELVFQFEQPKSKKFGDFFDEGEKEKKLLDEADVKEADIDQVVDKATLDKLNKIADELRDGAADADAMTDADWKKIDDMPEETKEELQKKIDFINDKLNKGKIGSTSIKRRLFNLVTDYKEILNGLVSDEAKKEAFERCQEIQKLSARRELTKEEKDEFVELLGKLDDEQRADLAFSKPDLAKLKFTLKPSDANINKQSGRQKRTQLAQKASGDDMDDTMASAYGVDSTFKAGDEKGDAWDQGYDVDAMIPTDGPKTFKMTVDPKDMTSVNRNRIDSQKVWNGFLKTKDNAEILKHWLSNPDAGPADPEGKIPSDWHGGPGQSDAEVQAARDAVMAASKRKDSEGNAHKSLTPSEWVKAMNTIAKPVRDALKDGFKAEADARREDAEAIEDEKKRALALADIESEKVFIDKLFNGEVTNLNQKEFGIERGFGTGGLNKDSRRSLSTGGITQVKDKITNFFLILIASHLNIAEALVNRMKQNLRAESTVAREARKELRPAILKEIFAEFGLPEDRVPDPQLGLAQKLQFNQIVDMMFKRVWDEASSAERNDMLDQIFRFYDETQVRKSKTHLDAKQNARFQELKAMTLDDEARNEMDEGDVIELIALNDIRLHNTEPVQAREKAIKTIENVKTRNPDNMYAVIEYIAREFAKGDSGNHNLGRAKETYHQEAPAAEQPAADALAAAPVVNEAQASGRWTQNVVLKDASGEVVGFYSEECEDGDEANSDVVSNAFKQFRELNRIDSRLDDDYDEIFDTLVIDKTPWSDGEYTVELDPADRI